MPVRAQTFSGKVIDNQDKGAISNVIINNKTNGKVTRTNSHGIFSIAAHTGDSILFYSQGYHTYRMRLSDNIHKSQTIVLERHFVSLQEIKIRPGWTPYQLDSLDRRATYKGALEQKKTTSVFSPFSLLADNISKKAKRRWRFQKNYTKWERQKFIDTRYNAREVTQLTGLTGDSLAAFMYANPIPYNYARAASDLEIKMWIKYNYRQWMKHPDIPDLPNLSFPQNDTESKK